MNKYLFTSESVGDGHPDKVSDQISDAILDACLTQDKNSRVAAETLCTTDFVVVSGEVTTTADIDIDGITRNVLRDIGYTNSEYGIDADTCVVLNKLHKQSPDISQGVTAGTGLFAEQGAGDQGLMFGYACRETEELMPIPITLSHEIMKRAEYVRKNTDLGKEYLRPDGKCQVTVRYDGSKVLDIDTVVLSHQHNPEVSYEDLKEFLIKEVVSPVVENANNILINPTGRFVVGGPHGDTGLTGRKIIVDTYGGSASHGGGCFSGKDPSKVDRSAAYMARWVAKNIVANGYADRCTVQLAYAIGVSKPVSVYIDRHGSGSKLNNNSLVKLVDDNFDLTPKGIITSLDLLRPIYRSTSVYGHFGRPEFPWEKIISI